jgi:nitrite reductase (NADH) large subunit
VQAAKLKIMGVDVFSAGDWSEQTPSRSAIEDRALGVYKKLTVATASSPASSSSATRPTAIATWTGCARSRLSRKRRHLLFPPPSADAGLDVAEMSDAPTVCGCVGVTKGAIIDAIHERGVNTLSQLKECTRASTGCGSCTSLCQDLLRAVAPEFEDEKKKVLCACLPFVEDNLLREIIGRSRLRSVQEVLDIYGSGAGCRGLQTAVSYMLDNGVVRGP